MKINLHTHSNNSDGSLSVEDLIRVLQEYRYDLIALTDHDTVSGNELAKEISDISFIEGIEITSYIPSELGLYDSSYGLHMVGLNIETNQMSEEMKQVKEKKQVEFLNVLIRNGYTEEEIEKLINSGVIDLNNRISLADFMVNDGKFSSMEEAVGNFSLSLYAPSITESIEMIHKCGGFAIWAHPYIICKNGDYSITFNEVEKIFEYMVDNGIDGLESYYLQFTDEQQHKLEQLAKKYNKFSSTGTDFHADFNWEYELLKKNTPIDNHFVTQLKSKVKIKK